MKNNIGLLCGLLLVDCQAEDGLKAGDDLAVIARRINRQAAELDRKGQYRLAAPLAQELLRVQQQAPERLDEEVAAAEDHLADLLCTVGDFDLAEQLAKESLRIREMVFGSRHPAVAAALARLAAVYWSLAAYPQAQQLAERSLQLRLAALGPNHPDVADSLNILALAIQGTKDNKTPESLYLRSIQIREAARGRYDVDVAYSYNNLALLHRVTGQYQLAAAELQRALQIKMAVLGERHPSTLNTRASMGALLYTMGDFRRAAETFRQVLELYEATQGVQHRGYVNALSNLATSLAAQGEVDDAALCFERWLDASEVLIQNTHRITSDRIIRSFFKYLRETEDKIYTLLWQNPGNLRVRRLGLATSLLRHGRSLDKAVEVAKATYEQIGAEQSRLFQRREQLRRQLVRHSLDGPSSLSPVAFQATLLALEQELDEVEQDLFTRADAALDSSPLPAAAQVVTAVAARLSTDAALLSVVGFSPYYFSRVGGQGPWDEARYLALVLYPDQRIAVVELGLSRSIESSLDKAYALSSVQSEAAADLQKTRRALELLYQKTMRHLVPLLDQQRQLLVVLDAPLTTLAWEAQYDGKNHLIDRYRFTYLNSGRDLLQARPPATNDPTVEVFADPDRSLPGARREAVNIRHVFPAARVHLGRDVTRQALLGVQSPVILHLALHAFFNSQRVAGLPGGFGIRGIRLEAEPTDAEPAPSYVPLLPPLTRAALIVHGAGSEVLLPGGDGPPRGLVTALVLAVMNLHGTQLVVLSGCESGLGETYSGQGVYGLRRSLLAAGTQSLVISLWRVNDLATHDLMRFLYMNLAKGMDRSESLRQAALAIRQQHAHPYYWAPFILLGVGGPLRSDLLASQSGWAGGVQNAQGTHSAVME